MFIGKSFLQTQWTKTPKKQSEGAHFFVNSALKIQCHAVKNTLLLTAFSAILPTGKKVDYLQTIYLKSLNFRES